MGFIGGAFKGIGAKKAAKQQQKFAREGAAELEPFAEQGRGAAEFVSQLLGLGGGTGANEAMQRFRESTGFRDAMQASGRAVASNAAASRLLGSSGTGLTFQREADRLGRASFDDFFNRLFAAQQAGQGAASTRAGLLAGQPASKGSVLRGVGQSFSNIFEGG